MNPADQPTQSAAGLPGDSVTSPGDHSFHFDMKVAEASIQDAINRAQEDRIKDKLRQLLDSGSDADKLQFVLGRGEYYFPYDLTRLAKQFDEFKGGQIECRITNCRLVEFGIPIGGDLSIVQRRIVCDFDCDFKPF